MMKYAASIVVVALLAYLAWPYACLYRLDAALAENDRAALAELTDLEAIKRELRRSIDHDVADTLGPEPGTLLGWLEVQVSRLGARAIDELVDLEWVEGALRAAGPQKRFVDNVDHAFFESWDEFVIRLGELGADPVHIRMSLIEQRWRVTGIYL